MRSQRNNGVSQSNEEKSRQGPGQFLHGGVLRKLSRTVPFRARGETTPIAAAGAKVIVCARFFFTLSHRRIILSPACSFPSSRSRPSGYSNIEDAMKVCTT